MNHHSAARRLGVGSAAVVAAVIMAACGSSSKTASVSGGATTLSSSAETTTVAAAVPVVNTATYPGLGTILVDGQSRTLYHFTAEKNGTIACTGSCTSLWLPLTVPAGSGTPAAGPGVTGTLSTVARPEGTTQVAFNGMPLYRFARDSKPGDAAGQGFGGVWFVIKVGTSSGGTATTAAATAAGPVPTTPHGPAATSPPVTSRPTSPPPTAPHTAPPTAPPPTSPPPTAPHTIPPTTRCAYPPCY